MVDIINKIISYYDSIYYEQRGDKYLDATFRWLNEEHVRKCGEELDRTQWNFQIVRDIPQQNNSSDCGVYTILFADFISDSIDVRLIGDILFHRRRIARNILAGNLFYPRP